MSCEFCTKVVYQNPAGKQFFTSMHSIAIVGRGDICLAIDNCGRNVLHYEDISNVRSDIVTVQINFCPICGRKLAEEE